jgi:hypothetical protein
MRFGFLLFGLLLAGCASRQPHGSQAGLPEGCFRLTRENVVHDASLQVVRLSIEAVSAQMMQLREGVGAGRATVALSRSDDGGTRAGSTVLAAMLLVNEPLQAGARYQAEAVLESRGARTTRQERCDLGPSSKLAEAFSITVTNGLYRLDQPLVVGTNHGQSIQLLVGRWN